MARRAILLALGGFVVSSAPLKGSARLALSGASGAPEQMCQIDFDETGTTSRPTCVIDLPRGGIGEFIFRPLGELDPTLLAAEETDLWRVDVVSRAPLSGADGGVAPVRASPRVILVHRCSLTTSCFRFRLALPPATKQAPAAEYKMSVFLEQTHFSRLTLRSEACNGVRAPHTLRFSVFVRVPLQPGLARPALQFFEEDGEESALEFKLAPPPRVMPSATPTMPSTVVEKKRKRGGGRRLLEAPLAAAAGRSGTRGGAAAPASEPAEEPADGAEGEGGEAGADAPAPPPAAARRAPPRTGRAPGAGAFRASSAGATARASGVGAARPGLQQQRGAAPRAGATATPSASPSALTDGGPCQHISDASDAHTFGPTGWYALRHDMFGDVSTWHWQPAGGCTFPMPAPAAAVRPQLHGRWTAFVGDLTIAEMAIAVLLLADVPFERRWAALCAEDAEGPVRAFDTGPLPALGGGRVTMFWAASAEACGQRSDGLRAFADSAFQARFREFHAPEAETGRTPAVLVFNSGLHDLAAADLTSEGFGASLRTLALPLLQEVLPRGRLVWRSSTPKTGGVECLAGGGGSAGNAGVDELNDVAWRVISEAWAPAAGAAAPAAAAEEDGAEGAEPAAAPLSGAGRPLFLDANALLRPFFEPSELARHHCSSLTRDGEQTISRVRSGCLAVASALVSLVAPPSPSRSSTPTPTRTPSPTRSLSATPTISDSAAPPSRTPSSSRSPRPSLRPRAPPPAPAAVVSGADFARVDSTAVIIALVCLVNIVVVVCAWVRCGAAARGSGVPAGPPSPADLSVDYGAAGRRGGARVRGFLPRT